MVSHELENKTKQNKTFILVDVSKMAALVFWQISCEIYSGTERFTPVNAEKRERKLLSSEAKKSTLHKRGHRSTQKSKACHAESIPTPLLQSSQTFAEALLWYIDT